MSKQKRSSREWLGSLPRVVVKTVLMEAHKLHMEQPIQHGYAKTIFSRLPTVHRRHIHDWRDVARVILTTRNMKSGERSRACPITSDPVFQSLLPAPVFRRKLTNGKDSRGRLRGRPMRLARSPRTQRKPVHIVKTPPKESTFQWGMVISQDGGNAHINIEVPPRHALAVTDKVFRVLMG